MAANKKQVHLYQPQYTALFNNEKTYWIPYSAGCLWSYVQQFDHIIENFELKELGFRRDKPADVVAKMDNPVLCGFSCYVWNEEYCKLLAKEIKDAFPDCIIVFGGDQVRESFLDYYFVDSVVLYEGEQVFLEILNCILEERPISENFEKIRLNDLSGVPSPYASGVFDKIIEENPGAKWNMTFETNRGCPFSCTFCDWGSLTRSKVKKFELGRVIEDLNWCIGKPITYLLSADANFGIFKERDLEIAKVIKEVAPLSEIDSVNLQFTKNSNDIVFEVAKELGHLCRGITVSVQSMHQPTLEAIKRTNMDLGDIQKVMSLSKQHKVRTYTELILGLPEESLESWKTGICELLRANQHDSIDVWFAQLLKNSEMSTVEHREKYGIESIIAKDYMPSENYNYWEDIPETIEIINKTNAMTTEEMAEAYLYAWMMIHFHITGYSQIYSKYLNYVKGIKYEVFYDSLFEEISKNSNCFVHEHYQELYNVVYEYLKTGDLTSKKYKGHNLLSHSAKFVYENKKEITKIVGKVFARFNNDIDPALKKIQENLLFDIDVDYPIKVEVDYNINTWENKKTTVLIESRIDKNNIDLYNFYAMRRKNLVKNQVSVIEEINNEN